MIITLAPGVCACVYMYVCVRVCVCERERERKRERESVCVLGKDVKTLSSSKILEI